MPKLTLANGLWIGIASTVFAKINNGGRSLNSILWLSYIGLNQDTLTQETQEAQQLSLHAPKGNIKQTEVEERVHKFLHRECLRNVQRMLRLQHSKVR